MAPPLAPTDFGNIRFAGTLRPSQVAASAIIHRQLAAGERRMHIVAPPGSGKTVLGLHVWADLVRKPTLVLSPNSAIQAQWVARTDLFDLDGRDAQVGTDPEAPGLLTSLTYQSITLPKRGDENLDHLALENWTNKLLEDGEADHAQAAAAWQEDLKERNPGYYKDRLATYRKKARDEMALHGNALWTLHESARKNLRLLKDVGIGLIILDECHHLLSHWGRVLTEVSEYFGDPVVLGLTATPPDLDAAGKKDVERYQQFFGEVDYEVPVPALVREGNLAPYQDLAYFVRPTHDELAYIAKVDEEFAEVLLELRNPPPPDESGDTERIQGLDTWVAHVLENRLLPTGQVETWTKFRNRDQALADAGRLHLKSLGIPMPTAVPPPEQNLLDEHWSDMAVVTPLIDRYIRHGLRRSLSEADHALAETAIQKLRMLGYQITETGIQPCASPVGRVMAYAAAKYDALTEIIAVEMQAMGPDIRAVIVTDFEKTSATALVEGVLDEEAGGAIAAFRTLVENETCDLLDPILATGSTVLVDDDISQEFLELARAHLVDRGYKVKLSDEERGAYHLIRGRGEDWCPRVYVEMITEMFQSGFTKCLVGTRGLLGEGWDASRINVLIDMTTVTTSMTVNQLRGRSIRLDKLSPLKVANNWDIICLAEEFTKGFDDYLRFKRKHTNLYGVCDDSAIEKGVGHVHAAFTDVQPEGVSEAMQMFNEDMIRRARNRMRTRELWRVGEPFDVEPKAAVETKMADGFGAGFKLVGYDAGMKWDDSSLTAAIARAVLEGLQSANKISGGLAEGGARDGGWYRLHLEKATEEESVIFAQAMSEVMGPLDNPRYVIPRSVRMIHDNWLSTLLPEVLAKYVRKKTIEIVMLHALPKALAANKEDAKVFEFFWNRYVSPGTAMYAHSETGRWAVQEALQAGIMSPRGSIHRKDVYL